MAGMERQKKRSPGMVTAAIIRANLSVSVSRTLEVLGRKEEINRGKVQIDFFFFFFFGQSREERMKNSEG